MTRFQDRLRDFVASNFSNGYFNKSKSNKLISLVIRTSKAILASRKSMQIKIYRTILGINEKAQQYIYG